MSVGVDFFSFFLSSPSSASAAQGRGPRHRSYEIERDGLPLIERVPCRLTSFRVRHRPRTPATKVDTTKESAMRRLLVSQGRPLRGDCGLGWTWNALRGDDVDYPHSGLQSRILGLHPSLATQGGLRSKIASHCPLNCPQSTRSRRTGRLRAQWTAGTTTNSRTTTPV